MEKTKKRLLSLLTAFVLVLGVFGGVLPDDTLLHAFADDLDDKELCMMCQKVKLKDDICDGCGVCWDCIDENGNVEIHCAGCGKCITVWDDSDDGCAAGDYLYCNDCLVEEHLHCAGCNACFCTDPEQLCEECGLCVNCCEADEFGEKYVCGDCYKCSGCANHCPECQSCEFERCPCDYAHCLNECELCPQCEQICFVEGDYDPCEYCGKCETCCAEDQCPDCGMCCEDPSFDTHFCANCGECLEIVPDVCDNCGLCIDCCRTEAEMRGCTCGELCFEEVDDEHICQNCGVCFGEVEQCPDCGLCIDCCADVSRMSGCDCTHPVCVQSSDWEDHFKDKHSDFVGEHKASAATSWSFNTQYHWKDCKYCDEASHITGKAAHTFDRNSRCTVCGYAKDEAISITKQPKDVTVKVNDCNGDWENYTVRFSVTAYGDNLKYTWFRWGGTDYSVEKFESLRNQWNGKSNTYEDSANKNSLVMIVGTDSCMDGFYYYRCYITDGKNAVWSDAAKLTINHDYTVLSKDNKPTKDGHYMQCHGEGCPEVILVPHTYTSWEWQDDSHTCRLQTCDVCGYVSEVVLHDHAEWVRWFFYGENKYEDENHSYWFDPGTGKWEYTGETGEPGFKATCTDKYGNVWKVDWNYHTGWCYCDDCFSNPVKVRELQDRKSVV